MENVCYYFCGACDSGGPIFFSDMVSGKLPAYDLTIHGFDDKIPFITMFIVPYVLAYLWWYLSPLYISYKNDQRFKNLMLTWIICSVVCTIVYLSFPTTISRPVGFDGTGNIFDELTYMIFKSSHLVNTRCCLPSEHCLLSILCYIGVRGQKNVKPFIRIGFLIMATLVCLSTQFIKQHYIVDLIASIIVAESVWFLVNKFNLGRVFDFIFPAKAKPILPTDVEKK